MDCVVLDKKYHPPWYLMNGHVQTIFLVLGLRRHPFTPYKREYVDLSDGGLISLDWLPPSTKIDPLKLHDHQTIVLMHGISGGSHENYIRIAADELSRNGWRVVVMNARGCARTPVRTAQLFNGAHTNDTREIVSYLRQHHVPTAPLIAVGYSLGANVLVKYIGEEAETCPLTAAVSLSNPFDLVEVFRHLNHSPLHYYIYYRAMAKKYLRLFFHESNVHEHFVDHPVVDLNHLRASKTIWEIDHRMTRLLFGYSSVSEYYRDCCSDRYLKHVRIPLLCLSSKDDPVCTYRSLPVDDCVANPFIILALTSAGGHLAFFQGHSLFEYPTTWSAQVTLEYCNAIRKVFHDMKANRSTNVSPDEEIIPLSKPVDDYLIQNISVDDDRKTIQILSLGIALMAGFLA